MDNMINVLCVIQARLTSSRLPNKVLLKLGNTKLSLLEHVYTRVKLVKKIDKIVFAIPNAILNDKLADFLSEKQIDYFRGNENNVLSRFYECASLYSPKFIVRATCDNPCIDWELADRLMVLKIMIIYVVQELRLVPLLKFLA
jgi:spore coat polysaccharide biosynthesis protein SpsF